MLKHLFWIAPSLAIVLFMSWFLNREQVADMRVDEAAFDRDFAAAQQFMSRSPAERQHYAKQQQAAQARYSTAIIEQKEQRDNMRAQDKDVRESAQQLKNELKGGK